MHYPKHLNTYLNRKIKLNKFFKM